MKEKMGMQETLEENLKLAKENNKMLHKMRRNAFLGGILRLIWWALIIGIPVYLYITVLGPYLEELNQTFQQVQGGVEQVQSVGNQIQELPGFGLLERFLGGGE